jgi:lysophospholipase L1-like esterase
VLIQFGHNDGGPFNTGRARASIKGIGDDTLHVILEETGKMEVIHTYGWYMRKYINDTKAKGGIPIIVSSIPRNVWKDGKIDQNPNSYPFWAKQVAEAENVPFIDLSKLMINELEPCGENAVTGMYFFKKDHTHTNARGAILNARLVATELKKLKDLKLAEYVFENPVYTFPGKIRLIIIGDSTVARGKRNGIQGWGAEISAFFDTTKLDVINLAIGGRSSRTFFYEGRWKRALDTANPGDFLLMQFGHNDGGEIETGKMRGSIKGTSNDSILVTRENNKVEVVHSYGWYIRKYIAEAQNKGVVPIVLSQIPRREWIDGKVERVNESYGKWAREMAEEKGAYFIDLNETVAQKYEKIGFEKVAADFFLEDHTHTSKEGAILNAKTIIEEINKLNCCELKKLVKDY